MCGSFLSGLGRENAIILGQKTKQSVDVDSAFSRQKIAADVNVLGRF